jgi:protein-S-isoprenylcysteine O-methyltransferase Ste14
MKFQHIVDLADRLVIALLAGSFLFRFSAASLVHPQYVLMMIEAVLVTMLVLIRPWGQQMSTGLYPVTLAFLGTVFLLLVKPEGYRPDHAALGGIMMFIGLVVSVSGKLALNRRFGIVPANRGIQDRGPFAYVRHPIYAGYVITYSGFYITNPTPWNSVVLGLWLLFQMFRIVEEERLLRTDPAYREYAERVRYRLIPGAF